MTSYTDITNCTSTPLDENGGTTDTWFGTWLWMDGQENVSAVAKSDQDGSMYMEFYEAPNNTQLPDLGANAPTQNTTPDSSIRYKVEGGVTEPPHHLKVARGWYRTKFVNESTSAQTTLQVVTRIGVNGPVVSPANISLAQNCDAAPVRVISELIDVSEGKRRGNIGYIKFGHNTDVDAADTDISYGMTGAYTGFPSSSGTFEVVSDSINDAVGGSGAEKIKIYYLDANWNLQLSSEISLNGTTPVNTGITGIRSFRGFVTQSNNGANNSFNDGTIKLRYVSPNQATVFWNIEPGMNITETATFSIPVNYKLYLYSWKVEMAKTASASGSAGIYYKPFGLPPRILHETTITQSSPINEEFNAVLPDFVEKSDLALRVLSISTTNIAFSGEMGFRIIKQ